MSVSALILAAGAAVPAVLPEARETLGSTAQAHARIVRAVVVRQNEGLEDPDRTAPRHQVTCHGGETLVEFY